MQGLPHLLFGFFGSLMLALGLVLLGASVLPAWHHSRALPETAHTFERPPASQSYRDAGSSYWFGRPQ
ncbi:MAG: hypothetical protein KIT25_22130 [Enhydrobacter sp.]|nr:MAG: hypothetical protein KIT25_22130 [Enhydrobacter sp.]